MKIKGRYILIGLVLILSVFVLLVLNKKNEKNEIMSYEEKLKITSFNIQGRTSYIKNNVIYVGNNVKEIENDFYDIKIVNGIGIDIYLNKLWYETYGKDYIQDEYLANICRELVEHLKLKSAKEDVEYEIYKYIKDNYVQVREEKEISVMVIEDLEFSFGLKDNIPILKIRRSKQ